MGAKWEWDKKKCKGECQCWHDFDAFLLTNEILGKRPTASECNDLIYDVLEPEFGLYLCHMRLFLCNGQISKHQTKNFDQKKLDKKTSERKQNRSTNCVQCKYIENDLFRSIWPHWNYYVSLLFVKISFCLKMASPHALLPAHVLQPIVAPFTTNAHVFLPNSRTEGEKSNCNKKTTTYT